MTVTASVLEEQKLLCFLGEGIMNSMCACLPYSAMQPESGQQLLYLWMHLESK